MQEAQEYLTRRSRKRDLGGAKITSTNTSNRWLETAGNLFNSLANRNVETF
jgi:hypothetical protein